MRNFLYCSFWVNKASLLGWIFLFSSIYIMFFIETLVGAEFFQIGFYILLATMFGSQTAGVYRRTLCALKDKGIDYVEKNIKPGSYCSHVGYKQAIKDYKNSLLR